MAFRGCTGDMLIFVIGSLKHLDQIKRQIDVMHRILTHIVKRDPSDRRGADFIAVSILRLAFNKS